MERKRENGVRELVCALDAAKIRMLVGLMTKDRQPWMKWVEMKRTKQQGDGGKRGNDGKTAKRAEGRFHSRKHPEDLGGKQKEEKKEKERWKRSS